MIIRRTLNAKINRHVSPLSKTELRKVFAVTIAILRKAKNHLSAGMHFSLYTCYYTV